MGPPKDERNEWDDQVAASLYEIQLLTTASLFKQRHE